MRYFEKIKLFTEEILNFIRENKNPKLFIHTLMKIERVNNDIK